MLSGMGFEGISREELQLAARNHGMPLEGLRYPITPVGMHYLLTHYDIPYVEPSSWRLRVAGFVARPLELTLDDLRARPPVEVVSTMECAGNGRAHLDPRPFSQPWLHEAVGTACWRGVALAELLEEAGLGEPAIEVVLTGLDRGLEAGAERPFARSLTVAEALGSGAVLAYELNGIPLPPQHGFPLRLVVPGWYGMTNVKWIAEIAAVDSPFLGHQQVGAYQVRRDADDPGIALTRMQPRALMIPPGAVEFPTRRRSLPVGPVLLEGRAWSGFGPIERVEVSVDGARTFEAAELVRDVDSPAAWCGWRYPWQPSTPGRYELACRASDGAGKTQPLEPEWNLGGYGNNAVQRVSVDAV